MASHCILKIIRNVLVFNSRRAGGGGGKGPPVFFSQIAPEVGTGNFAIKFAVPLPAAILYKLTKNQLGGHFESVVNDVRVASCSADLDQQ